MSRISIVRHAPTAYNKNKIFMGVQDVPFDEDSSIDWGNLKAVFAEEKCQVCYTSPLSRAFNTALRIFDENQIIVDNRLIERDMGSWTGVLKKDIKEKYPIAFKNGVTDIYYTPEGGEHYEKLIKRVAEFLVERYEKNTRVAIVSHNGVLRAMKSLILGVTLSQAFEKPEPFLSVQSFDLHSLVIERMKKNCLYTAN